MRFDLITIFPDFFRGPLDYGIVRRAREAELVEIAVHDLRAFTRDRHRTVDDRPFGGGEGMVMKPEPIFDAVESLLGPIGDAQNVKRTDAPANKAAIVLLSASGKLFCQAMARRFSQCERVILICGRYEGVDERVAEHLATDEVSIGDFVLSGGELAAALVLDAVTRLIPGALGNEDSAENESFSAAAQRDLEIYPERPCESGYAPSGNSRGILECPHYTRPQNFRDWEVPEILVSGNHEEVRRWRARAAIEKTRRNRPDLLTGGNLPTGARSSGEK
ncbi:MAG TPA: tRNA (guanosine(37)-N1)-methyltransferase TrmD [Candidatus Acidoferrales bacterium]|nr:tRNA (guanosine(37)-N1)-methyltransferase TrmD [Candidatus Acidoferrales bacterium]